MKTSVCITTFNEEKNIGKLLDSLLRQSLKPAEIIIVDNLSSDKTVQIIRHYQKKDSRIKLWIQPSSRSAGRNYAIEIAKNNIIALTDAGCIADKNWLKNLVAPLNHREVEMVAGFYKMAGETFFQKAAAVFLGVIPDKFDFKFLPSARSMAFKKDVWERLGGFPERLTNTAEDTMFNYLALQNRVKIARVKKAFVEWGMPKTLYDFSHKIFNYAKGDAQSKIWFYSDKSITSHNIKIILIFLRYLIGVVLIVLSQKFYWLSPIILILIFFYILWAFKKVYLVTKSFFSGLWGIMLQFTSDLYAASGFIKGTINNHE